MIVRSGKKQFLCFVKAYSTPLEAFPVYNHHEIEKNWQSKWKEEPKLLTSVEKPFYVLSMFPYPSGNLHMGHARVYTISDTISRWYKMRGFNVLHPMGWDAFGLPAENAAIERGIMPDSWTKQNISQMKETLNKLGYEFNWEKELSTCDESHLLLSYYKWTQWLFLQFHKDGLAYQKSSYVNWDPIDLTVLANEQVDDQGKSWRSGAIVEKKLMKQWYFKITNYSERLLNDLSILDKWPKHVVKMQHEWIGKKEGVEISFTLSPSSKSKLSDTSINIFTTRPETIYGVSYLVLAPEYNHLQDIITSDEKEKTDEYLNTINRATDQQRQESKTGIWTGRMAIHPVTKKEIPVFIAAYVLSDFASGAVMGVPRHDARDKIFSENMNIFETSLTVVSSSGKGNPNDEILINSGKFDGLTVKEGREAITKFLEENKIGKKVIINSLRDWLVSRQRYWGCPIPIIHCKSCGVVPVPEKDLPVRLPKEVSFVGKGSPLASLENWVNVPCPCCGEPAKRETDTLDTFVDSSWYYLRFPDANNNNQAFSPDLMKKWAPVNIYIGGVEHAILHLLYSRFIMKYLYDKKLVPVSEPFQVLKSQGMVNGKTYRNSVSGRYLRDHEIITNGENAIFDKETGEIVEILFEKMSKSKYNGVDPKAAILEHGADIVRLFLLFKAPMELNLDWDIAQIQGQSRWIRRVWAMAMHYLHYFKLKNENKITQTNESIDIKEKIASLSKVLNASTNKVTKDLESFAFNTAISQLMILTNEIKAVTQLSVATEFPPSRERDLILENEITKTAFSTLLLMMYPMAPHFVEEIASIWKSVLGDCKEKNTFPFEYNWPKATNDSPKNKGPQVHNIKE